MFCVLYYFVFHFSLCFQLRSVGPKLVPFCKTVVIYFVLLLPDKHPSFLGCLVKCAPILSLIFFVLLHGMNLSKEYAVARAIMAGLICSVIGDALLSFDAFILGMMMFGFAHVSETKIFTCYKVDKQKRVARVATHQTSINQTFCQQIVSCLNVTK